jgi:hypothetical protein
VKETRDRLAHQPEQQPEFISLVVGEKYALLIKVGKLGLRQERIPDAPFMSDR